MIEVYIITNNKNNKLYVGITSKGVSQRFHKHTLNALSGMDTYLYRAFRKYGISTFSIKRIDYCESWDKAYQLEKEYITSLGSLVPNGYNISAGGSGGDIVNSLPDDKKEKYLKYRKIASTGANNGNYSGITDEEIISSAIDYFTELGYIGRS